MKRVMIVGGAGSGKSTLAHRLGERTGLPIFHMDHIHWKPGWVERPHDEKDILAHEVHMRDTWIFEGNHSRTYEERINRADTLIWLDLSVWLRLWRINKRMLTSYGKVRPDMQKDCPERLSGMYDFNAFVWRTRHSSNAKLLPIIKNPPPHLTPYHLKSVKEINRFTAAI